MHFAQPHYLNLLLLIPALAVFYLIAFKRKRRALERFGNLDLVAKMTASVSRKRQIFKVFLVLVSIFFLVVALARPQFGERLQIMKRRGLDIMIALDTSLSMLAEDIKPNRLERAKHEIAGLIDRLRGDRVGLLAFAGESFVQCPLTTDYGAAKMFLEAMDTEIIPEPGTAIGDAIEKALGGFVKQERKYKILILLTDGEDHLSDPIGAAKKAAEEGVRIYTVGLGTRRGEPIPLRDPTGKVEEYKRDRKGEVVMTRLDEVTLQKVALLTEGKYYRSTMGEAELDKIYEDISQLEKKEFEAKEFTQYEDRYQYFLIFAIVLLSMEAVLTDRRKVKKQWEGRFE
ncbi:MAG: VWA domain-containing protein [bacterium]